MAVAKSHGLALLPSFVSLPSGATKYSAHCATASPKRTRANMEIRAQTNMHFIEFIVIGLVFGRHVYGSNLGFSS
jgi:hypothetical protein